MSRELNEKEVEMILKEIKSQKKIKRKMKTGKKALHSAYIICAILLLFVMAMIYQGKDTATLSILAGAGVGILPVIYGIYDHYNTKINLKHMEENYIFNYDEQEGIY